MWLKWLPWKFVIRRIARSRGFLDPIALQARLHRFAQPSEVGEPIELLRAGAVFHARGLINSRVIQHNLDWVWPYWVERQFDPADSSFIPRAFSITHVNLTHRNWTAVGLPDYPDLPIIDPRGLITPFLDGWSLDFWIVTEDGRVLLPSREEDSTQHLDIEGNIAVVTGSGKDGLSIMNRCEVIAEDGYPVCRIKMEAGAACAAWAVIALRPYNPEGVSFIHQVELSSDRKVWSIDRKHVVKFDSEADRHHISHYKKGDVYIHLRDLDDEMTGKCAVGMITAAALFRLEPGRPRTIIADIPLTEDNARNKVVCGQWGRALANSCKLDIPDERMQFLYDSALRTLILHSPDDVYPGPYTYKRFWFRDAAFIIHGLLCAGLIDRAERAIDRFPARQNMLGYFHSQDGEWDSNGEALWIMCRFCEFTACAPKHEWQKSIVNGARWIIRKRLYNDEKSSHSGFLTRAVSAEH